jgi:hypothetical protein
MLKIVDEEIEKYSKKVDELDVLISKGTELIEKREVKN